MSEKANFATNIYIVILLIPMAIILGIFIKEDLDHFKYALENDPKEYVIEYNGKTLSAIDEIIENSDIKTAIAKARFNPDRKYFINDYFVIIDDINKKMQIMDTENAFEVFEDEGYKFFKTNQEIEEIENVEYNLSQLYVLGYRVEIHTNEKIIKIKNPDNRKMGTGTISLS